MIDSIRRLEVAVAQAQVVLWATHDADYAAELPVDGDTIALGREVLAAPVFGQLWPSK